MKFATKIEPDQKKLDILSQIGWKYLEIYTNRFYIDSTEVVSLLKKYSFEYVVHSPTDYFDKSVIEFASKIKAKVVNTHKIVDDKELARLVALAKTKHISITVENEAFPESHHLDDEGKMLPTIKTYDPIRSGGDFLRLRERVPRVKLCVDVEHAMIRKEYPGIIDSCYEFLGHIHLCGFKGGPHHRPIYENMELVQHIATLLRKYEYKGFVVCEHDVEFHTPKIWEKTLKECKDLFVVPNKTKSWTFKNRRTI